MSKLVDSAKVVGSNKQNYLLEKSLLCRQRYAIADDTLSKWKCAARMAYKSVSFTARVNSD